jgi:phage-related protein (TIGR01555 family)
MSIVGTPEGEKQIMDRVAWTTQAKSTHRASLIDAEDDLVTMQVNWSGIPQIMDSFILVVAGAADIPMTRLLGQSPKGLQSTGDGEERDYQSMIKARQDELLAPALDRIDELLIPSALGSKPSDIYYEFGPLQEENEKDGAAIEAQFATALKTRSDTGMFQEDVLAKAELNRMLESGRYPGLETAIEEAENEGIADPTDPANQPNEADLPAIETTPPVQQPPTKRGRQPKQAQ